ncbi:MAG: hypothetical protein U0T32_12125 [Chitinophagales bacterium]
MNNADVTEKALVALTECAVKLGADLNSLRVLSPFQMLKIIKEKVIRLSPENTPFDELENQPLIFKINYGHHMGVSKDEIARRLNLPLKKVNDCLWFYNNKSPRHKETYKDKVTNFINSQKHVDNKR